MGTSSVEPVIQLSGSLTVRRAQELCDRLCAALAETPAFALDLSKSEEADLCFVQIVESARRSAESTGGRLRLTEPAAGDLLRVLERGGFLDPESPDRIAFWTGTES